LAAVKEKVSTASNVTAVEEVSVGWGVARIGKAGVIAGKGGQTEFV